MAGKSNIFSQYSIVCPLQGIERLVCSDMHFLQ